MILDFLEQYFRINEVASNRLYIGYYLANWFGAISVIDIVFWFFFSYCHFYRGNLNKKEQSILNKLGDDLKVSRV